MTSDIIDIEARERVHAWFDLTYAAYLVLPRSILQSLPPELQDELVTALEHSQDYYDGCFVPHAGTYEVQLRGESGRFITDPLRDYQRGRRVVTREELLALQAGDERRGVTT